MRCSSFRKNLSAFLDDELDPRQRKQMELHISACSDCHRETEKLREIIGLVSGTPRPEVPPHLWEETRQRLEAALEHPDRSWIFNMPKWGLMPAGAAVFVALLLFLGIQFFHERGVDPVPLTIYVQEHTLSYSEQVLPSDLLSELTVVQTGEVTEEAQSDEIMSELEMLMEVYYGTNPTNGS